MSIIDLMERGSPKKAVLKRIQGENSVPLIIETLGHFESILARSNGRARIGQLSPVDLVVIVRSLEMRKNYLKRKKARQGKKSQKEMHSNPKKTKRLSRGKASKESDSEKENKPKKRTTRRKSPSD